MPAWIINGSIEDIERRGAAQLLSSCKEFMPARSALEMLESGVSPAAAGQARALLFQSKCMSAFRKFRRRMPPARRCSAFSSHARQDDFHVRTMGKG